MLGYISFYNIILYCVMLCYILLYYNIVLYCIILYCILTIYSISVYTNLPPPPPLPILGCEQLQRKPSGWRVRVPPFPPRHEPLPSWWWGAHVPPFTRRLPSRLPIRGELPAAQCRLSGLPDGSLPSWRGRGGYGGRHDVFPAVPSHHLPTG